MDEDDEYGGFGGPTPPRRPVGGGYPGGGHPSGGRPSPGGPPPMSEKPSYVPGPQRVMQLRPEKNPDQNFILANQVAVAPQDFPPDGDGTPLRLLINNLYVFAAEPKDGFPQGCVGLSDPQRACAQVALGPKAMVQAQKYYPYDQQGNELFIGTMDIEVGFASQRRTTEEPYDQEALEAQLKLNFDRQLFAPGQQLLMYMGQIPLRFTVRQVEIMTMRNQNPVAKFDPSSDPASRGCLQQASRVTFIKDPRSPIKLKASSNRPATNAVVMPDFKFADMGIGGLDTEFTAIFRRAFASRIFPPGLVEKIGIQHVRGMLLYGPPGTGKTLIARQIGKMLNAREPKVINGPEVLNKFVGQSEENIRKLFADAEKVSKGFVISAIGA
jgi:vesicle-fusing ATPase